MLSDKKKTPFVFRGKKKMSNSKTTALHIRVRNDGSPPHRTTQHKICESKQAAIDRCSNGHSC